MFKKLAVALIVSQAFAAYVPSDNYSTLTPAEAAPSGATTDYTQKFGIQINTASSATETATANAKRRRGVAQISDGQIQAQSTLSLETPTTSTKAAPIQQIGDGQIQHQTTATAAPIQQIGDGQIQHQTTATAAPVQQIGDGQIQHQTTATGVPIQQIGDGQIQHQTTASVVAQIGDGQIQHQTTAAGASQIADGQVQASGVAEADSGSFAQACASENALSMTLNGGILTDSKGRIGAIVANRQFQFDGPPPQAGSIYAGGWSITKEGYLAIGDNDLFYQCQSGDFYNLYDQNVAAQCEPVHLSIIDLVQC